MKAYKFHTKISDNGTIRIPYYPQLYDKEVEIIIVPKFKTENKANSATEFVNKWAGFLKNSDIENSKYDYLSEKYK